MRWGRTYGGLGSPSKAGFTPCLYHRNPSRHHLQEQQKCNSPYISDSFFFTLLASKHSLHLTLDYRYKQMSRNLLAEMEMSQIMSSKSWFRRPVWYPPLSRLFSWSCEFSCSLVSRHVTVSNCRLGSGLELWIKIFEQLRRVPLVKFMPGFCYKILESLYTESFYLVLLSDKTAQRICTINQNPAHMVSIYTDKGPMFSVQN